MYVNVTMNKQKKEKIFFGIVDYKNLRIGTRDILLSFSTFFFFSKVFFKFSEIFHKLFL